jgi:hypothetical protein
VELLLVLCLLVGGEGVRSPSSEIILVVAVSNLQLVGRHHQDRPRLPSVMAIKEVMDETF